MIALYLVLYLAAGIFFGLAAGRVASRVDFLSLGLLCWVAVEVVKALQRL